MKERNEECGYDDCHKPPLEDSKEGYCIFHEQRDDKDIQKFQADINQKIKDGDYDFTGFYFPEEISFVGQTFEKKVSFQKAIFRKRADFMGAQFQKMADFMGAHFQDGSLFGSSVSRDLLLENRV